jgi:integrase
MTSVATKKPDKLPVFLCDLAPPAAGSKVKYRLIRDPDTRRLHLRITETEFKSWVLIYGRSFTIGAYEDWPYPLAREEAQRLNRLIDQGGDPHAERDARRAASTVDDLVADWRKDIFSKNPPKIRPSSLAEYETQIRQWISPVLGKKLVIDVRKADLEKLHIRITKTGKRRGTPSRANRVVALISALFTFAIKKEMRADNPAKGIEKNDEEGRYRLLTGDEFGRLLNAIAGCRNLQAQRALRVLLGTGARRGEVLGMQWAHLDLAAGTWAKPPTTVKQGRLHIVPLAAPVRIILVEILAEQEALAARTGRPRGRWVFPARARRDQPVKEIKSTWASVRKRAAIEDLHLHDLRHVFATYFASTGTGLPLIGRLLGHSQPQTTARYAHVHLDPLREQVERFGAFIEAVEKGQGSGEVVKLPDTRREVG